jgi:membrane protein DedA with SNARE-associated domain
MLDRYGRLLLSTDELEKAEHWFRRYGNWVVLVTRLLPAVRSFIALPAGTVRMPFRRFLLFSTIGSFIWCAGLALLGDALGQHWSRVGTGLRKYDAILLIGLLAVIALAGYQRLAAGRRRRDAAVRAGQ